MKDNEIKNLIPIDCPHCGQPIIAEFISSMPQLVDVLTLEKVKEAKQEALKQIEELHLPEGNTASIVEWINKPDTIFGSNDIENIIKGLTEK